jgi:acetyl esterase/lipase
MAISYGGKLFLRKLRHQRRTMTRWSSASNSASVVFFFPGDAEKLSEHYIPSEPDPASRQSDLFKVGHHARKNSAIPEVLAAIQPRLGVIASGGDNPYRHPGPQLLERLRQAGIPTLRADTNGAIHILTEGKILQVSCFVACPEIKAQVNSAKPQTPQDQQSNQQQ